MTRLKGVFLSVLLLGLSSFVGFSFIWDIETVEPDIKHQLDTNADLVIDINSVPHIVYFSKINTDENVSLIYAYKPATDWIKSTIVHNSFVAGANPKACIANDANDVIYVAYSDSDSRIYYKNQIGQNWSSPYLIDNYGQCLLYDIAVDSNSLLHVLYTTIPPGSTIEDSDLVLAVGEEFDFTKYLIRSGGNFQSACLAIDSNGWDHIAYYDINSADTLKHAVFDYNDVNDEAIEPLGASIDHAWGSVSIDIDSNDTPHISYYHTGTAKLKYATKPGSVWVTETIDASGINGQYSHIAVDANGMPHIAYRDRTGGTGKVKYAEKTPSDWLIETIIQTNQLPKYISADTDSLGLLCVCYNIPAENNIEYATPAICGSVLHQYPQADIDKNCFVDMHDLALFAQHWLQLPCAADDYCSGADLDKKGSVDTNDLIIISDNWLECSMPVCY